MEKFFYSAKYVKITFKNQKNGKKMETITRQNRHSDMCPVKTWADIIIRISTNDGIGKDTYVNTVCINRKLMEITASQISTCIKKSVMKLGRTRDLGFGPDDVGRHSIRTTFATLLANKNTKIKDIMLVGQWKSTSVQKYIQKDVILSNITDELLSNRNNQLRRLV